MKNDLIDKFEIEKSCEYREEVYRVRDNGAICRLQKSGKRKRPLDEKWTFGKVDKQKGYMYHSSETVHRIVATAFNGVQPSESHVIDHIDTNKRNNRPENLRWITRLENILLNPITLSRIIFNYGSIENFLSNPNKPLNGNLDQNFSWMRTVTKEEAENAKNNLLNWAKEGKVSKSGQLGEWVYQKINPKNDLSNVEELIITSKTPNAQQKNWKTPNEFPNCPASINENGLLDYAQRLAKGSVFSKNKYGESIVDSAEINNTNNELFVLTNGTGIKPYALAKVYIVGNNFIHESIGTFFELIGAQKQFNLALGREWDGEDSIDDYS
ncbi:HNH endonuclease signature motif containing protein [Echinicola arenosa]|uniref:HNH endonuclease signature motif containing protein n=1 Tax=Echinicola arenosa TaxID=2774144 RepID=UPI00293C0847|nr:HNH endonuclease signature motif containing protein [Echinicola arenosa]